MWASVCCVRFASVFAFKMDVLFLFYFYIYIYAVLQFLLLFCPLMLFCLYCELIVFLCFFSSVLFDLIFCQLFVVFWWLLSLILSLIYLQSAPNPIKIECLWRSKNKKQENNTTNPWPVSLNWYAWQYIPTNSSFSSFFLVCFCLLTVCFSFVQVCTAIILARCV